MKKVIMIILTTLLLFSGVQLSEPITAEAANGNHIIFNLKFSMKKVNGKSRLTIDTTKSYDAYGKGYYKITAYPINDGQINGYNGCIMLINPNEIRSWDFNNSQVYRLFFSYVVSDPSTHSGLRTITASLYKPTGLNTSHQCQYNNNSTIQSVDIYTQSTWDTCIYKASQINKKDGSSFLRIYYLPPSSIKNEMNKNQYGCELQVAGWNRSKQYKQSAYVNFSSFTKVQSPTMIRPIYYYDYPLTKGSSYIRSNLVVQIIPQLYLGSWYKQLIPNASAMWTSYTVPQWPF